MRDENIIKALTAIIIGGLSAYLRVLAIPVIVLMAVMIALLYLSVALITITSIP